MFSPRENKKRADWYIYINMIESIPRKMPQGTKHLKMFEVKCYKKIITKNNTSIKLPLKYQIQKTCRWKESLIFHTQRSRKKELPGHRGVTPLISNSLIVVNRWDVGNRGDPKTGRSRIESILMRIWRGRGVSKGRSEIEKERGTKRASYVTEIDRTRVAHTGGKRRRKSSAIKSRSRGVQRSPDGRRWLARVSGLILRWNQKRRLSAFWPRL